MPRFARLSLLTAIAVAAIVPQRAEAVTQNASVNVTVNKPLTLTVLQNLDLGTVTLGPGTWSNATIGISKTGAFTCNSNVVCTGAPQAASYKVTGTNKMVVKITAPNVTLVNQNDSSQTLTLAVDAPPQITLTSSGEPGVTFGVGGSITLNSTTADGSYTGTLSVTVDYQ
jgi:hypothetical protein